MMIEYFVIRDFLWVHIHLSKCWRSTCLSVEILKGYMLISQNAKGVHGRGSRSQLFPTPLLFQNFWIRVRQFFIQESDSCSGCGSSHRSNCNLPTFLLKWPHRILLLPKLKSDSGSIFSQIFDSGSERKTLNPAGVNSCTPDPVPPLVHGKQKVGNPCRDSGS